MGALIRFFTKILDICKLVPMLPVVVIAAIPLALLGDWRPWGNAMAIPVLGNPGFGQWLVIALVLIIVIDTVRGMIDDLRHGQVGVDVLAVVAILSTVAVAEYWASWAVTLMITSGEAIGIRSSQGRAQPDRADGGRAANRARRQPAWRGAWVCCR